jgi:Putative transposase
VRESRRRSGRSSGNPARLRQALGSITPCCPWYLSAQPELVTPVLQVVQRVVVRHLLDGVGVKGEEGHGGAVTLIQRFGSSANLNIHLYCLVLDGVYRCGADGVPTFGHHPIDEDAHAPGLAGRGDGADMAG